MRRSISFKSFTWILLTIMLIVGLNGIHESLCAKECHVKVSTESPPLWKSRGVDHSTPVPADQHEDHDGGCLDCPGCACHAPLTVEPFTVLHNPFISSLTRLEPFTLLPEVYLSRFIPPQIHA